MNRSRLGGRQRVGSSFSIIDLRKNKLELKGRVLMEGTKEAENERSEAIRSEAIRSLRLVEEILYSTTKGFLSTLSILAFQTLYSL